MLGDVLVNAGRDQLLHRELDLALLRVDGEHESLDALALAQHVARMIDAPVGDDLADVHQAVDAFGDLNERAEVHDLGDRAFDLRADGELALDVEPRIGERLLQAERDAPGSVAGGRLDGENDGIHAVALLEQVGGMADLLGPRHLGDVNQAFEARLEFDKCAKVQ